MLHLIKFEKIIQDSKIAHLFDNHCNAKVQVLYMSAKDFAECLDLTEERKTYLKRYFT